jgi:hypothetical protein
MNHTFEYGNARCGGWSGASTRNAGAVATKELADAQTPFAESPTAPAFLKRASKRRSNLHNALSRNLKPHAQKKALFN